MIDTSSVVVVLMVTVGIVVVANVFLKIQLEEKDQELNGAYGIALKYEEENHILKEKLKNLEAELSLVNQKKHTKDKDFDNDYEL